MFEDLRGFTGDSWGDRKEGHQDWWRDHHWLPTWTGREKFTGWMLYWMFEIWLVFTLLVLQIRNWFWFCCLLRPPGSCAEEEEKQGQGRFYIFLRHHAHMPAWQGFSMLLWLQRMQTAGSRMLQRQCLCTRGYASSVRNTTSRLARRLHPVRRTQNCLCSFPVVWPGLPQRNRKSDWDELAVLLSWFTFETFELFVWMTYAFRLFFWMFRLPCLSVLILLILFPVQTRQSKQRSKHLQT